MEDIIEDKSSDDSIAYASIPLLIDPNKFASQLRTNSNEGLMNILCKTKVMIDKHDGNSILLRSKRLLENEDGLSLLIKTAIRLSQDIDCYFILKECYLLIERLLLVMPAYREHYDIIYQALSETTAKCSTRDEVQDSYRLFNTCAKLLKTLAKAQSLRGQVSVFSSYFHFEPIDSKILIELPPNTLWPFHTVSFACYL